MAHTNLAMLDEPMAFFDRARATRPIVVVIEDNYRSSIALAMLIDDWGYACIAARSADEAMSALGRRLDRVSAIVTDLQIFGKMSGIRDASAIISKIGRNVPTIVTTGHGDFATLEGSFPVIRKPFDPEILHKWLDRKIGIANR
ncbi:MAG TPA: response regulator [Hyphomicrobium sp.]|nr:response regulator [Hyphomicrobium sp.]